MERVSARQAAAPRPRRARGAQESLASIVLVFESIVAFLAGLAIFGLQALPAGIAPWWGVVAGSVIAVLMMLTAGLVRHRWAIAFGWVLQLTIVLGAIFVPALVLVALIFGAMWAYATIKGASLDRRNARLAAEAEQRNGD